MNLKNKDEEIVHCGQPARARVQAEPIVGAQLEESRPNPKLLWLDKSKSQIIQSPSLPTSSSICVGFAI